MKPTRTTEPHLLRSAARSTLGATATAAGAGLLGATSALLLPAALAAAVDSVIAPGAGSGLTAPVVLFAFVLASGVAAGVLGVLANTTGVAEATAWMRRRGMAGLLVRGLPGQRQVSAGDATARLTGVAGAAGRVPAMVVSVVNALLVAAVALVALTLIDWLLTATVALVLAVGLAVARLFARRTVGAFSDYQQAQAAIAGKLADALAGRRTIRASGTVGAEVDRVLKSLPALRAAGEQFWAQQRGLGSSFALLAPVLRLLVIGVAGYGVTVGRMSVGEVVAALGYAELVLSAVEEVDTVLEIAQCRAAADRLGAIVPPAAAAPQRAGREGGPATGPGRARLRQVTVTLDGRLVLDRLDLLLPAGRTTALVGASGSGKSVLVGLLGGLYRPDSGVVLVDGRRVGDLDEASLRRSVAYAFERPALLGATIGEAIGYGHPDLDDAAVTAAARAARADDFVRRLPAGYRTPLAAAPLSGGELQRIGLARAVAQDARITVLDDATGSLDTATEAEVHAALAEALRGRTRIVVTGRAATAAAADLVAWLTDGRVRALAPHAELWSDSDYRALFGTGDGTEPDPGRRWELVR